MEEFPLASLAVTADERLNTMVSCRRQKRSGSQMHDEHHMGQIGDKDVIYMLAKSIFEKRATLAAL